MAQLRHLLRPRQRRRLESLRRIRAPRRVSTHTNKQYAILCQVIVISILVGEQFDELEMCGTTCSMPGQFSASFNADGSDREV
jgi:hypothetical protein